MNFPWICSTISPLIYFIDLHIHLATNNRAAFPFAVKEFRDVYVGLGVQSKQMQFTHQGGCRKIQSLQDPGSSTRAAQQRVEAYPIISLEKWVPWKERDQPQTARSFVTHLCKMYNVPLVWKTESFSKYCVSFYCPWSGESQKAPYRL